MVEKIVVETGCSQLVKGGCGLFFLMLLLMATVAVFQSVFGK
jgi:hypothetical protein